MQRAYFASSLLLSAAICVLGLAMVVTTLARSGGASALGVVLGCALAVLGAARLWLAWRAASDHPR